MGRDHSCPECGRGGMNDPDGYCICPPTALLSTSCTTEIPGGGALQRTLRDGHPQWKLRCPGCGQWADIDDDQFHGRTSIDHSLAFTTTGDEREEMREMEAAERPIERGCGYHETKDWAAALEKLRSEKTVGG